MAHPSSIPPAGAPVRHLASEQVVLAAPMSFAGSAARLWKLTQLAPDGWAHIGVVAAAVVLIGAAWLLVAAWYLLWGLLLVPYRLIRRGSRKRKREALMHREQLAAIEMSAARLPRGR